MSEAKPKRRWFRFSLRSLFVLVTLSGLFVAWIMRENKWMHERQAALEGADPNYWTPGISKPPTPAPWQLRFFRERGVDEIIIIDMDKQPLLKEKLEELFPEAKIVKSIIPGPHPYGIPSSKSATPVPKN